MQRNGPWIQTYSRKPCTCVHVFNVFFFLNEQQQTLDCFYSTPFLSLPWSIKCITQMSGSNLDTSTSTHSLSCSARTDFRLFLLLMPSVLCCGSAVLSWGLTTVSHASWERSVYFLSLLNLWKKRASPLSCLPTTGIMLCNCSGPVGRVQRGEKNSPRKRLKTYIQKHHAKAFPLSLVDLFHLYIFSSRLRGGRLFLNTLCHQCVSTAKRSLYTHVSRLHLPRHSQRVSTKK